MQSVKSQIVVACAGSGKTSYLVDTALANRSCRIAMLSYTNNNIVEISTRFGERNSGVPPHVDVMTWFTFLLTQCARPYQQSKAPGYHIDSLLFVNEKSARYVPETDIGRHYFAGDRLMYSDKIAKFVVECERKSGSAVSKRVCQIYTDIYIDEFQDLAGWDLEVVEMLLRSGIRITLASSK